MLSSSLRVQTWVYWEYLLLRCHILSRSWLFQPHLCLHGQLPLRRTKTQQLYTGPLVNLRLEKELTGTCFSMHTGPCLHQCCTQKHCNRCFWWPVHLSYHLSPTDDQLPIPAVLYFRAFSGTQAFSATPPAPWQATSAGELSDTHLPIPALFSPPLPRVPSPPK